MTLTRADRYHHGQHLLSTDYQYDVFGRRRAKFVYLIEAPDARPRLRQHARYDWDGDRLIGECLLTRHPDAAPDLENANAWTHTERLFAYHPGTFSPLAQITCHPHANGQSTIERIHWCATDQIGTPHALIDETGRNTWKIAMDAWGKRLDTPPQPDTPELAFTGATDPFDCPIRLPGQFFDAETGLHYNRHRYYDPHAGRYVTQDPIGLVGGSNVYAYPANPVQGLDPLGLAGWLTIASTGDGGSSMMSGHAWISYVPDGGAKTTYGTWGNNPTGVGNGLFENLETGRLSDASRTMYLDDAAESKLMKRIQEYRKMGENAWELGSPCSAFARDAWMTATGENLNSNWGPINNPTTLKESIIAANGGIRNHNVATTTNTASSASSGSFGRSSGSSSISPLGSSL